MNELVILLLVLLGIFTQIASQSAKIFRGSSQNVYLLLLATGNFGNLLFFIFIIWGFFVFPWWVPVISLLVPYVFLHLSLRLSGNLLFRVISPWIIMALITTLFIVYLR